MVRRGRKENRRGFTLTEFLIVIAIVMILGTISLVNLYPRNQGERFNSAVTKLVGTINEAVDNSKTLKGVIEGASGFTRAVWAVRVIPNGCRGVQSYCAIDGPGYCLYFFDGAFTNSNYGAHRLPDGVVFDHNYTFGTATSSCTEKVITFRQNTGVPSNVASATLRIFSSINPVISSTISVSYLGQVTFTSDGRSLGF